MSRVARFVVPLVLGLAGLAGLGYYVLARTTGAWFERDPRIRVLPSCPCTLTSGRHEWA